MGGLLEPIQVEIRIAADLPLPQNAVAEKLPVLEGFTALLIGAEVLCLCATIKLQQAGVPFTTPEGFLSVIKRRMPL